MKTITGTLLGMALLIGQPALAHHRVDHQPPGHLRHEPVAVQIVHTGHCKHNPYECGAVGTEPPTVEAAEPLGMGLLVVGAGLVGAVVLRRRRR